MISGNPPSAALMSRLPRDHPLRAELSDEVHARPTEALVAPLRISYLALLTDPAEPQQPWRAVHDLALRAGAPPPPPGASHYSADLGPFRIKWERHTEFSRYKFIVPGAADDPFAEPAITAVPAEWVAALPGRVIVAAHVALLVAPETPPDPTDLAARLFGANPLVGAVIADGAATAYTDVRVHADGFGRILVHAVRTTPRQAGRIVQRLLEIDSYRMMALLALPVARDLAPSLTEHERELAAIAAALVAARETDEPLLLERLTRLAADVESREANTLYRFAASTAYYALVRRRIAELRERRIEGLQTFSEFTERRLVPAMDTCQAVAARQDGLSQRVARATGLLSTRVSLTRERQNQAVLEAMNRRSEIQLRLQQTVEGLSVAAITYYVAGLVGYVAKSFKAAGLRVDPDLAVGIAVPIVAALVALGMHRVHRVAARGDG